MKKFPIGLAVLAATTLFVAGCSSDSDDSSPAGNDQAQTAAPDSSEQGNEATEQSDAAAGQGDAATDDLGTVRINEATTYTITELRNCEPLSDGTIERELELQGIGDHNGERTQIDVNLQTIAGVVSHDVSWSGPEGVFGSADGVRITWGPENASILGSATLVDGMTQTEKLMIDFDLEVPADTVACR